MNALCDILWLIVIDANCYLLSHAEMFKNVLEGFIGCDGAACDVAKMGEGDAKVLGKEITT